MGSKNTMKTPKVAPLTGGKDRYGIDHVLLPLVSKWHIQKCKNLTEKGAANQ